MSTLVAELGASVSFFARGGEPVSTALRVYALKRVACTIMSSDLAFELARNVAAVLLVDDGSESPFQVCVDAIRWRMTTDRVGIRRIPYLADPVVTGLALSMAKAWKDSDPKDGGL